MMTHTYTNTRDNTAAPTTTHTHKNTRNEQSGLAAGLIIWGESLRFWYSYICATVHVYVTVRLWGALACTAQEWRTGRNCEGGCDGRANGYACTRFGGGEGDDKVRRWGVQVGKKRGKYWRRGDDVR